MVLLQAMNHTWSETKQLVARVCIFLARREIKSPEFLRAVIPMLVNGTKEKNSYVKSNSELALVGVLRLRQNQTKLDVSASHKTFRAGFTCLHVKVLLQKNEFQCAKGNLRTADRYK